jgi:hypothetical protein
MSTERHHSDPRYYERDYALDRLIMLSDGGFAIAMALMALEVRPEGNWVHTLPGLLDAISTPLQWFFWSFFGTAIFWTVHRRLFGRVTRSTSVLSALNIFLLGQITLIPVATRRVGELQYRQLALHLCRRHHRAAAGRRRGGNRRREPGRPAGGHDGSRRAVGVAKLPSVARADAGAVRPGQPVAAARRSVRPMALAGGAAGGQNSVRKRSSSLKKRSKRLLPV